MSDKNIRNSGFEETLRNKMDELASSVDCFDKISRKAFPEQNAVCSDSEFTVCELENVTGRHKRIRFMPIMAAAAAIVLCLFFLPENNGFMNFIYSNIGKSDKKAFRELICEIGEENEKYEYVSFDCTLDEYIKKDVLISPLYGCPFEQKDKDGINVRIYVKMCGDIPTNQVYAVEYEGDYEDGNFIAAADSKAKFDDDELESFKNGVSFGFSDNDDCRYALENYFSTENNGEAGFFDDNGNAVSAAGFTYRSLYKYDDTVYPMVSEVLYYHQTADEDNNEYFYDMISYYREESDTIQCSDTVFDDFWSNVVYFNGSSARAEEELSDFTGKDIFGAAAARAVDIDNIIYIAPFGGQSDDFAVWQSEYDDISAIESVYIDCKDEERHISAVSPPLNPELFSDFRIYLLSSEDDLTLSTSESASYVYYRTEDIRESMQEEMAALEQMEEEIRAKEQMEETIRAQEQMEEEIRAQEQMEETIRAKEQMRREQEKLNAEIEN